MGCRSSKPLLAAKLISIRTSRNRGVTTQLREVAHGDVLSVGELTVTVVNTPGHTPGGCSFLTQSAAFVGDAIFAGSVGGPNISYQAEIDSVRDNLLSLT